MDNPAAYRKCIAGLILLSLAIFILARLAIPLVACLAGTDAIVDLLFDDAYYYLAVAYNIAHHGISSFDRLTETNGYQPLWLMVLSAFELVLDLDRRSLFIFTLALVGIICSLPLLVLAKKRRDPFYLALLGGMLASYACYPFVWLLGLETVLLAPVFLLLVFVIRKQGFIHSRHAVSWILVLVVLVRLDAVSVLVAYAVLLAVAMKQQMGFLQAIRNIILFLLPSVAALLVYFILNKWQFDTYVPVSGTAKMIGAQAFSNWGIAFYYLFNAQYLLLPLILLLAVEMSWGRFRQSAFFYYGMLVLVVSAVIQYFYYAMFSGWMVWPWYFYQFALIMVLVISRLVFIALAGSDTPPVRAGRNIAGFSVVVFVLLLPLLLHVAMLGLVLYVDSGAGRHPFTFGQRNISDLEGVLKTDERLVVLMGDRAGGLGYWANDNIHVFQTEGLVSNRAYLDMRREDKALEWISAVIKPQLMIVEREFIPAVMHDGKRFYIVIEPIQGRVVFDHLLAFCFSEEALLQENEFRVRYPSLLVPDARRYVFAADKATSCEGELAAHVSALVSGLESPRQQALPVEYDHYPLNAAWEQLDRRLALKLHKYWPKTL